MNHEYILTVEIITIYFHYLGMPRPQVNFIAKMFIPNLKFSFVFNEIFFIIHQINSIFSFLSHIYIFFYIMLLFHFN